MNFLNTSNPVLIVGTIIECGIENRLEIDYDNKHSSFPPGRYKIVMTNFLDQHFLCIGII